MVVASLPLLGMAYVIRAEDLFESILSTWRHKVAIHDMLPTNDLKDLDLALEGDGVKHVQSVHPWTDDQGSNILRDAMLSRSVARRPAPGFSDSGLGSDLSNALVNASPFAEIGQLERQLYDEIKILRLRNRLPEIIVRFTEIIRGDHEACRDFVIQNETVLKFDETILIKEAINAYQKRYLVFAHACIERAISIRLLKQRGKLQTPKDLFNRLLEDDLATTEAFQKTFDKALRDVQSEGNSIDEGGIASLHFSSVNVRRPPSILSPATANSPEKSAQLGKWSLHSGTKNPAPLGKITEKTDTRVPSSLRNEAAPRDVAKTTNTQVIASRYSTHYSKQNPEETRYTRTSAPQPAQSNTLDPTYIVRPSSFYKAGTVFAVLFHEPMGESGGDPLPSSRSSGNVSVGLYGQRIYTTTRRMIVASQRHGFSVCISISTYAGRGLSKSSLSRSDVNGHAVVYDGKNKPPPLLRGEPSPSKQPIKIETEEGQKLHVASRVNFCKPYTVEHNVKSLLVGRVSEDDMAKFMEYYRMESLDL